MILFEIKKVFSKARSKTALLFLWVLLFILALLTINRVEYVDENGTHLTGPAAAQRLQMEQNQWAGELTEAVFRKVYRENAAINASASGHSTEAENLIYQKKQGMAAIIDIINSANSPWRDYNYYAIDGITENDATAVYEKRISNLKEWLRSGEEYFSEAKQAFLIDSYESLDTPFYYEYFYGWSALLQNISTFILILALFAGFFVSGIFSDEFHLKADAVFFSSKLGRNKAIGAKIMAGLLISTALYALFILIYTGVILLFLGADGANCPIQFDFWRSCYNITFFEAWLLMVLGLPCRVFAPIFPTGSWTSTTKSKIFSYWKWAEGSSPIQRLSFPSMP